jgi:uncharacterized protein (DUF1697 family)
MRKYADFLRGIYVNGIRIAMADLKLCIQNIRSFEDYYELTKEILGILSKRYFL